MLFPESYAETAAWLRKEVVANAEILRHCQMQLDEALQANAQLRDLVAAVQVRLQLYCIASETSFSSRSPYAVSMTAGLRLAPQHPCAIDGAAYNQRVNPQT